MTPSFMHYRNPSLPQCSARFEELRHQRQKILQSVSPPGQDDRPNRARRKVLLVPKVLVGRDQNVIVLFGHPKQLAILQPGPLPVVDRVDLDTRQMLREAPGNGLVKK